MEINVNNITLNYLVKGNGNPLILLHGNGEDLQIFDKLVSKLEKQFTVYAIDSRNHGASTRTEDFTYETMAEDIHQFIEKLELKHVSVIGFSDGAIISLLLTLKYPQTFNRMVLLGVNLKPSDFKLDIYNSIAEEYEKTQDPLFKMMLEQPNIELDDLKEINTPTLVIGAEDDLYYEDSFQNIVNAMPNAVLKIIKGHDHGSYVVNNDVLYPYVAEFLQ
ncbi:alpha/beta hydrolase [Dysgonomonas sp. HDW5A]|uniref:alpha/beta fold hydrolase n=1 Tax=Dysgonomonas sp. HDW5A TaxID=2714926 RepID=UPI0014077DBC|nr:alpha/beta hydrolase [Dysgonomonas sp. HDW5A]QIK59881.1 alpha/beta hydrolase [Dysgonomonas sp. HDW5A]